MQLDKAENYITAVLRNRLPAVLYYHDYYHTQSVLKAATELAISENITDADDIIMLQTAALYHDVGYVRVYEKHEEEGCQMVRETLPAFGYSEAQITVICLMIMKTKMPQQPNTSLEKILCDADLDYLGRDDFESAGNRLFREWKETGRIGTLGEFNIKQIKFLESHKYWTSSARSKRDKKKAEHLQRLKDLVFAGK